MRKKIAAGNWKMNLNYTEAVALVTAIKNGLKDKHHNNVEVIFAPSFPYLKSLVDLTAGLKRISIAAQNCSAVDAGAYTGEVSAAMLASVGAMHVLIGHSERRSLFNEGHELLRMKVDIALENNLTPIFCCGEKLEERNQLRHRKVVEQQLWESLFHLDEVDLHKCIIAYEPVWAIGTGLTATPAQAQEMHKFIRNAIAEKYSTEVANSISILYGGSCNDKNAKELFALPDVDGGLIGGASLKADSFLKIVHAF